MPEIIEIGQSVLGPVTITRPDENRFQYIKGKELVRRKVSACDKCRLHDACKSPVPPKLLRHRPELLVIGEAPGQKEDSKSEPFVGKHGTVLTTRFQKLGFDSSRIAYANVVQCWPTKLSSYKGRVKKTTRMPDKDEMVSCRNNLFDILHAANPYIVLLVGATALRAFRPDLKLNRTHGRFFVWEASWFVLPTYHPAGIAISRTGGATSDIIYQDLELLRLVMKGELDPVDFISGECNLCEESATKFDPNMVGYCDEHWLGNQGNWHSSTYEGWKVWTQASNDKARRAATKRGAGIPLSLFD